MSDTILNIFSTIPSFVPNANSQKKAKLFLSDRYSSNSIKVLTTETMEFIDQGSNFESVSCNLCGQLLGEDWGEAMEIAFQNSYKDLNFITPCCKRETSLNDLNYKWPAGFARFVISIANPSVEVSQEEISQLQRILETDLKIVWTHY